MSDEERAADEALEREKELRRLRKAAEAMVADLWPDGITPLGPARHLRDQFLWEAELAGGSTQAIAYAFINYGSYVVDR